MTVQKTLWPDTTSDAMTENSNTRAEVRDWNRRLHASLVRLQLDHDGGLSPVLDWTKIWRDLADDVIDDNPSQQHVVIPVCASDDVDLNVLDGLAEFARSAQAQQWTLRLCFLRDSDRVERQTRSRAFETFNGTLVEVTLEVAGRTIKELFRLAICGRSLVSQPRKIPLRDNVSIDNHIMVRSVDHAAAAAAAAGRSQCEESVLQSSSAVVSFPLSGCEMPDVACFTQPHAFVEAVECSPPDWIYHLEIARGDWPTASEFGPLRDRVVQKLVKHLDVFDVGTGYRVTPLEHTHQQGLAIEYDSWSPFAFVPTIDVKSRSFLFPLAVGIVAAFQGRPLPPWVMLSGGVNLTTLEVVETCSIERKISLALGCGKGHANIGTIIDLMYRERSGQDVLGERLVRTLPGDVGLLVVSQNVRMSLEALPIDYAVERLPMTLDDFGQKSFADLRRAIDAVTDGNELLVVQVSNVFEALYLLGYHHRHNAILKHISPRSTVRGIRVYRVRHRNRRPSYNSREYWRQLERTKCAALDYKLSCLSSDPFERLKAILTFCTATVDEVAIKRGEPACFAADIAAVGPDPDWLRIVAFKGRHSHDMPFYVPATVGITGRVLRTAETAVVASTSGDPDFKIATSADSPVNRRYGDSVCKKYHAFLRRIHSCIKVPLVTGGTVAGVMCLQRSEDGGFDRNLVRLIEELASRAASELAVLHFRDEQLVLPEDGLGSVEQLGKEIARSQGRPSELFVKLANDLASVALSRSGGYRTAVRILTIDGNALQVVGHAGKPGAWPDDFLTKATSMTEDAAATHSVETGRCYYIDDTAQVNIAYGTKWGRVHYDPIPPSARAHGSILIQCGGHVVGVLSVDWDKPRVIDAPMRQSLEQLADRYAVALRAVSIERQIRDIDTLIPNDYTSEPPYRKILATVASIVAADHGAMFLRSEKSGRYVRACSLSPSELDEPQGDCSYEAGEGTTGWIAQHNRTLRIADLNDRTELEAVCPSNPPQLLDKYYDGSADRAAVRPYLGVPISVGDEVLGVIRLAARRSGFTSYDEQFVRAAACRLAAWLNERNELRRKEAITELGAAIASECRRSELLRAVFSAIRQGLGEHTASIRIVDRIEDPDGRTEDALICFGSTDDVWNDAPVARRWGESITGTVWQTAERSIFHSSDVEKVKARRKADDFDDRLFSRFSSGACFPLKADRFMGTLSVFRVPRHGLSPRDIEFLESVSKLVARALRTCGQRQADAIELALHRRANECAASLLTPTGGGSIWEYLDSTVKEILEGTEAELGMIWVKTGADLYECLPLPTNKKISPKLLLDHLATRRVSVITTMSSLSESLQQQLVAADLSGWQIGLMRIGTDAAAILLVAVRPPRQLFYSSVERLAELFDRITYQMDSASADT